MQRHKAYKCQNAPRATDGPFHHVPWLRVGMMITQLGVHLMNTLPCILHMENQNGIKLLTSMIFIEDLSNAKKKLLYTDVNADGVRVSQVVTNVENIINQ